MFSGRIELSWRRDWKALAGLALSALFIVVVLLSWTANVRVHQTDVLGTVVSATVPPRKWGPHYPLAQVRLPDGKLISGNVLNMALPAAGDVAIVRIYRRKLSGFHSYEIIATRPAPH